VRLSATRLSTGRPRRPAMPTTSTSPRRWRCCRPRERRPRSPTRPPARCRRRPTCQLTAPLANAADNVTLRVYSFGTTAGALLVAGAYTSVISITISPT
jgi:hypothetical protein